MNKDIKEILDYLKIENGHCSSELSYEETHLLLDYITNLQTIEQQYSAILSENAELENKITNLQEENQRLNNIINELEKWLIEQSEKVWDDNNYLDDVLDKLKELKENK